nr:hypothetical protein [uncultured Butyrivibrio sp.]
MKIGKQLRNLKTGAKRLFVGLMVLSLLCTVSGIGSIYTYATEPVPESLELTGGSQPNEGASTESSVGSQEGPESQPGNPEGQPANPEGQPATTEGEPSNTEGQPANNEGQPANPEGQPATTEGEPSNTEGQPANNEGQPATTEGEPSNTEGQPSNTENQPAGENIENGSNVQPCQEHQYEYTYDANTHTGVCKICNDTFTANHEFAESRTEDGKIRRACTICGYEEIIEDDGTLNVHDHEYEYTDNGDGTHTGVCSLCGDDDPEKIITQAHTMGEWEPDGHGNHTRTCLFCDYTEVEECTFDEETGLCTVCGFNRNELSLRNSLSVKKTGTLKLLGAPSGTTINHDSSKTYDEEVIREFFTITNTDDVTYDGTEKTFCSYYATGATTVNIVEPGGSNVRKYTTTGDLKVSYVNSSGTTASSVKDAGNYTAKFSLDVSYTAPGSTTATSQTLTYSDSTVHKIYQKSLSDSDITIDPGNIEDYSTCARTGEFGQWFSASFNNTTIPVTYSVSPTVDGAPASNVDYNVTMSPAATATNFTGSVSRTISVPRITLLFDGFEEIANAYYNQVLVTCSGYVISDSASGTYAASYTLNQSGDKTLYVKKTLSDGTNGPAIKVNTGQVTISNEAPNFGITFDNCFSTAPSPKGTATGGVYKVPYTGAEQQLFSSLGTIRDLVNTSTPSGYIITAVDTAGLVNKSATNVGKYKVTLTLKLTANYGGASFTNTVYKDYEFEIYKLSLSDASISVKNDFKTADGKIDYLKVSGSDYKSAIEVTVGGTTLSSDGYNVEVAGMPEIPTAGNGYNVTISPNGDVYVGTKTENSLLWVTDVGLKYQGYSQADSSATINSYYIQDVTVKPEDTIYQIGLDGNSFSTELKITESCKNKVFTVYLKGTEKGKVFKKATGELEIRQPVVKYDGSTTKQSEYVKSVKLSADSFKISAVTPATTITPAPVLPIAEYEYANSATSVTVTFKDDGSIKYQGAITVTLTDVVVVDDDIISNFGLLFNNAAYKSYFNEAVTITGLVNDASHIQFSKPGQNDFKDFYYVEAEGKHSITVDLQVKAGDPAVTNLPASNQRIRTFTIDKTAPSGVIEIEGQGKEAGITKKYTGFTSDSSTAFGVTSQPKIKITSEDGLSGVAKVQYLVADKFYSSSASLLKDHAVDSYSWQDYSSATSIGFSQGAHNYLYVAVYDNAGNATYLSTGDIMYDNYGPKGRIVVGDYSSSSFQSMDSVALSVNAATTVSIVEDTSEFTVSSIEFFVSDKFYKDVVSVTNAVAAGAETWRNKDLFTPTIIAGKKNYVYAVFRSTSGFEMYISSGAIVYDTIAPIITANAVTKSSDNKYVLEVTSTDSLSGVGKMKVIYSYENSGSGAAPGKEDIAKSGVDLTVTDAGDGTYKGVYSVESYDAARNYVFYVVSIDNAGNVSDVSSSKVSSSVTSNIGSIKVDDYVSDNFKTQDSTAMYTQSVSQATITASNDKVGVDRVEFYVSDTFYASPEAVEAAIKEKSAWSRYSEAYRPTTAVDKKNYIYARIVDKNGNNTYLSTGSIIYDTVSPVLTGHVVTRAENSSEFKVAVAAKDTLSGVNRFKMIIQEKTSDNMSAPTAKEIFENGATVDTSKEENGISAGAATLTHLDVSKTYIFYFIAIDRAGNISGVETQESKPSSSASASGSGSGSGSKSGSGSGSGQGMTPAPSGIAGSGNGSQGSRGGSPSGTQSPSKSSTSSNPLGSKDREISRSPYIKDATGNAKIGEAATGGWKKISTEIKNASTGSVVEVEMSGTSKIPRELLESMNGKDVTVKLNMADNVQWEIKGDKVSAESLSEKNMGVKLGSRNIPEKVLSEVTGSYPHVEFSMLSSEDYGFGAAITIPVGTSSAGMNATLYKYNASSKELMAVGTAVIDAKGNVKFDVSEAADYTVVVSPEKLLTTADASASGGLLINDLATQQSSIGSSSIRFTDIFGQGRSVGVWLIVMAAISAGLSFAILFAPSLQIKRDDEFSNLL